MTFALFFQVIIITNSDDGWVKYSCERFVPKLLPVIEKYRIVSARTEYEKFYPGQPLCWKAAAFAHEVNEHYERRDTEPACVAEQEDPLNTSIESLESTDVSSDGSFDAGGAETSRRREVISFGDSMEERASVRIVAEQLSAIPKSVMFVQSPSPVQILGQLQMLTQHMEFICAHQSSLDLEISPDQALRFAENYMRRCKSFSDQRLVKHMSNMLIAPDQVGSDIGRPALR